MSEKRPPYPPEFRRQMIELVRAGRSPEELAKEFEPSAQAIRNWVAQADRDEGRRSDGLTHAERSELARLRKVAGIETPFCGRTFRVTAVAWRKASAITAGRCSPNPGRWPRTPASRKFVRRLVESLRQD